MEAEEKQAGCPLRRVQLWHTIPLCLLAVVNLLLVILALLGLASYRIGMGVKDSVLRLAGSDLDSYDDSLATTSGTPSIISSAS